MKPHSVRFIIKETNINFYAWSLIADSFLSPVIKKYLGALMSGWVVKIENDNGFWGPDMQEWLDLGRRTIKKLKNNSLATDKLLLEHRKNAKILFDLCDKIEQSNFRVASNAQFRQWFQKLWQPYAYLSALGFIPVISDLEHFYFTQTLTEILEKHCARPERVQEYLSILISQTMPSLYWQEQLGLFDICRGYKNAASAGESPELRKHEKKYAWLNYGYQGPVWHHTDFVERLRRIFKNKSIAKQYQTHKEYFRKLISQQKSLSKKLKLNQDEKRLLRAARLFMYLKSDRTEVRHRVNYISDLLFTELSRRRQLPLSLFRYATQDEILRVIAGKKVKENEILSRRKILLRVGSQSGFRFVPSRGIAKYLSAMLQPEDKEESGDSEIRGHIAFKGLARGLVKIVHSINDLPKVNHGDILVAISTNPDFLPAMNKAIAFVTDIGGITSHAAIVAREMKKPCVIGTRIATKVLKDGDMVEVDAEQGIVKKLG